LRRSCDSKEKQSHHWNYYWSGFIENGDWIYYHLIKHGITYK